MHLVSAISTSLTMHKESRNIKKKPPPNADNPLHTLAKQRKSILLDFHPVYCVGTTRSKKIHSFNYLRPHISAGGKYFANFQTACTTSTGERSPIKFSENWQLLSFLKSFRCLRGNKWPCCEKAFECFRMCVEVGWVRWLFF